MAIIPGAELAGFDGPGLPEPWDAQKVGRELVPADDPERSLELFVGGPLDLDGTQIFTTVGFLMQATHRVKTLQTQGLAEQTDVRGSIEISIEAAVNDPDSMLDMVRTTPLSPFHERVLATDAAIAEFEANFALYFNEGPDGLWDSLKVTQEELLAASSHGIRAGKAKSDNKHAISTLQVEAESGNPWDTSEIPNRIGQEPLFGRIYQYILEMDTLVRTGQPGAQDGRAPIKGSSMTRERLERLIASGRYAQEVDQTKPQSLKHDGDLIKLLGIEHVLNELWPRHTKQQLLDDPEGFSAGEQITALPEELLDLEALHLALIARYSARGSGTKGRRTIVNKIARRINKLSRLEHDAQAEQVGTVNASILSLDVSELTEAEFRTNIQAAGTAWQVARQLEPSGLAAFEQEILQTLKDNLRGRGLLAPLANDSGLAQSRSSDLNPGVRATMTGADFANLASLQLEQMGMDAVRATDEDAILQYRRLFGARAARLTDTGGRYQEVFARSLEAAGTAHRAEEFPGTGRLFCYYGSYRPEDGDMGLIEAIAALTGSYEHIESAGNSPLKTAAVRAHLEKVSKNKTQVYKPFDTIPDDYLCDTAHFVGKLPRWFQPENILPIVIPNGLATVEQLVNKDLVAQLQNSGANAQFRNIPTELVRFLRTRGKLRPEIGHNIPNWRWPEHIFAIFVNKTDGSPSDLFRFLYPREAALLMPSNASAY